MALRRNSFLIKESYSFDHQYLAMVVGLEQTCMDLVTTGEGKGMGERRLG